MPAGCDAVLPRERAIIHANNLVITEPQAASRNVRSCGEDSRAGDLVLPSGSIVAPAMIGALASYGVTRLSVRARPRIALSSTGDEMIGGVESTVPGKIFDANGPMISAALKRAGLCPELYPIIGDDERDLSSRLAEMLGDDPPDIVVSTGGVSVGDRDHIPRMLEAAGATVHFHAVSIRPGKPVLFATLRNGALYFGLPGNPVAALVGMRFFVMAAVRAMTGLSPEDGVAIPCPVAPRPGTTLLLKARTRHDGNGRLGAEILPGQQSHLLRPLLVANAWMRVEADTGEAGLATLYPLETPL